MNYLKFYKECMKTGKLPEEGLCGCFGKQSLQLFTPTKVEFGLSPYDGLPTTVFLWGATGTYMDIIDSQEMSHGFTPLRQNIVLLLAAINGQL